MKKSPCYNKERVREAGVWAVAAAEKEIFGLSAVDLCPPAFFWYTCSMKV